MLTGSSALHNEGTKRITTPYIKAVLKDNYYATQGAGLGVSNDPAIKTVMKGVVFDNKVLLSVVSTEGDNSIRGYDIGGSFLFRVGTGGFVRDFLDTGATLIAYTSGIDGELYAYYSNNGQSWYLGATIDPAMGAVVGGIAAVGQSQLYVLRNAGATILSGSKRSVKSFALMSYRFNGTWGATEIRYRPEYVIGASHYNAEGFIEATRITKDLDRIIIQSTNDDGGDGLMVLDTDSLNVYREEELFIPAGNNVNRNIVTLGSIKTGDIYYLGHKVMQDNLNLAYGSSQGQSVGSNARVMWSTDFLNWTGGIETSAVAREIVLVGTTNNEYSLFGISSGLGVDTIHVAKGTSQLDLSENITAYTNKNNERITLTLGNYK